MHRQIAADAVPGAVIVIEPDLPQRAPRERIEMRTADALAETPAWRSRYGPSSRASRARASRRRLGRAGPDRAGDIGRAVGILRAGVDQIDLVRPDRPVALLGDAVVDDRTVLAGAGDRREALAAETRRPARAVPAAWSRPTSRFRRRCGPISDSKCRNRHIATASRAWASRVPCCSTGFLFAFGSRHGSGPATTVAPASADVARTRPASRQDRPARSCPPSRASAAGNASRPATETALPSQARVASGSFAGSMNSSVPPSACARAKPSANGVNGTSPPRMLSSQATEAGSLITSGVLFAPRAGRRRSARAFPPRSGRLIPTDAVRRAPAVARGRSVQIASIGLRCDRLHGEPRVGVAGEPLLGDQPWVVANARTGRRVGREPAWPAAPR